MLAAGGQAAPPSMKRTELVFATVLSFAPLALVAQEGGKVPEASPRTDPVEGTVQAMRAAEQRAVSFRLEIATVGQLPGGLEATTKGVLHVLRGTQPALHAVVEFSFADGLRGRMESARTAQGVVLFEDDPVTGELLVRIDPVTVADLEWAGAVLKRADLPGMADARADAPLGSAVVADLRRSFALAVSDKRERDGETGTWLVGARRNDVDEADPDLPMADRVELFVRAKDQALLEVRQFQRDRVVQQIVVTKVDVDPELPASVFQVDGRGAKPREVQTHSPMWEQIQSVLRQAEARAAEAKNSDGTPVDPASAQRPSRRK